MTEPAGIGKAHVRIARPTDDLAAVVKFYRDGLGLEVLGEFQNHDGFDGVMLGSAGAAYHLEFTRKEGCQAGRAPSEDNLLVFYLPDESQWRAALARLARAGYQSVRSFNPYWDEHGRTFEDPDGYRVVLQNGEWDSGAPVDAPSDSTIDAHLAAVVDSCIRRANKLENTDAEDDSLADRPVDLILELLWHDASGSVAAFLISRIDKMASGVQFSLMRDAVEMINRHLAPLVIHLLAAKMTELQWDGRGWLEDIPQSPEVADHGLVNTLMIIDSDWSEPEIRDLVPLLTSDQQSVRRAAWIALRCCDSMWHAPIVVAAVSTGLSSDDIAVRGHAAYIAEEPQRRQNRARRDSP